MDTKEVVICRICYASTITKRDFCVAEKISGRSELRDNLNIKREQ